MKTTRARRNWVKGQAHPQILTAGHPGLRQVAVPVKNFAACRHLYRRMVQIKEEMRGQGIAATQLRRRDTAPPPRLVVIQTGPNELCPDRPVSDLFIMINPRIRQYVPDTATYFEGCLSVPGYMVQVKRYTEIEVEYFDIQGRRHRRWFSAILARVIQHEIAHLNGRLITDEAVAGSLVTVENYLQFHREKFRPPWE